MISVNEKTAKSLTALIGRTRISRWNLYNPATKELLASNDLKRRKEPFFEHRPDGWPEVVDRSGADYVHNLLWMGRIEKYFNSGFYLCTINSNIADMVLCDCINIGYDIDEKGRVIPFGR
jgi:hypothetical protein